MKRLNFKHSLSVQVVEPDTVFLVSERDYHLLTGSIYTQLVPWLQGEHTASMITDQLSGKVPYAHLMYALNRLQAGGYVVEADTLLPAEQTAFWHSLNVSGQTVIEQVQQKQIGVRAMAGVDAQPLVAALASLGITPTDDGDALVVVTDDYLSDELATVNQHALASGQPWLPVKLVGESIWIGPLFQPAETACWACLAHRLRINRPVETFVLHNRSDRARPMKTARSALSATLSLGANLAATEIVKWLAQGKSEHLTGQLVTLNTLTMELQTHHVARRPQCSVCGDRNAFRPDRAPQPIILQPAPKDRLPLPEAALARYERLVSPLTGVVTNLIDVLSMEGLAYSYLAVHGFSAARDLQELRRNMQGRSSGKGRTKMQAKLSAIAEAVEHYSGVFWAEDEPAISGCYADLADRAIHPEQVWLFSESQYTNRVTWNQQQKSPYHIVPQPFDPALELSWMPFWSLTNHCFKYYPAAASYYGHPDASKLYNVSDSNGCAAGVTFEDAVLRGFLELVERDSVAIWWYNRIRRPQVDVASFEIPYLQELQAHYRTLNRTLWVLDITADLNIPTFVAVSARTDRDVEDIVIGLGTSLDPKAALLAAFAEVNQFLSDVLQTNPDGSTRYFMDVQETLEWFKTAKLADHPYLRPDETQPPKTLANYADRSSADIREELETCIGLAAQAGLETLVLDQSRPDIGIPVARVLVPGLRHFWRRLAPGRLYDVPVKLGWLDRAQTEEELNPVSMFF